MKALVLSGGGAAGPFHLGVMEHLTAQGNRYDMYVGVSVGALIAAQMAMYSAGRETNGLLHTRKLFLSVENKNIWKPWSGGILTSLLPWLKKGSLYNSRPLQRLVKNMLSEKLVKSSGKKLLVGAVNLTKGRYEVFDQDSPHIVDAVLASSSYPVFFDPIKIGADYYSDGGLRTVTPIEAALAAGATEIDIVCCIPPEPGKWEGDGPLATAGRAVALMMDEIINEDMRLGLAEAERRGVKVRMWRPIRQVVKDPLEFHPGEAKKIYQHGYNHAKKNPEGIL